jgi:hypothetical protein
MTTEPIEAALPERMTSAEISRITGYKMRTIQEMAETGAIDWAYQPNGPRSRWHYDRDGFLKWWGSGGSKGRELKPEERLERRPWASIGAMAGRGVKSSDRASPSADPSRQKIQRLLSKSSPPG